MTRGLLDTSVFIAQEQNRPLGDLPEQVAVSVVTLGELEIGVLATSDQSIRGRRAATLAVARNADPIPVTEATMSEFARLVDGCRRAGVRPKVLDALIAATAIQHGLPVVTQDDDFQMISDAHPALAVARI